MNIKNIFAEKRKTKLGELGGSGTSFFGGMLTGEDIEYNSDLEGIKAIRVYDKMRKGDGTVGAALLAVKLPILGANWYIEPASDDKKDEEIANMIEHNLLNDMELTWNNFLRQSLLFLDYGFMYFEKVFSKKEYEGREYIGINKLAPRLPHSIWRWEMSDGKPGISQQLPAGGSPEIPQEKLVMFVNNQEGDNLKGISLLRQAYKHWFFKESFYKIDAMSFERQGLGIPMMKLPPNFSPADKRKAETLLQNVRANEAQYLLLPEGWEFEFIDMKAGTVRDPEKSILHHDRQITKSVLAQFLELGASGGSGSRALSSDHSELFMESLEATARYICDVMNKSVIKQIVDLNYNVEDYPKLKYSKISKVDFKVLAETLDKLITSKVVMPDNKLEDYVRDQMELPEVSEEEKEEREEMRKAQPELKPQEPKDNEPPEEVEEEIEEEEEDDEPAKMSEAKKKDGENDGGVQLPESGFFRPFTFAEKKVDFNEINDRYTQFEKELVESISGVLKAENPLFIKKFREALKEKDMTKIRKLSMSLKPEYRKTLQKEIKKIYEYGKKTVGKEMKKGTPKTTEEELLRLKMMSEAIADDHEARLINNAKQIAVEKLKDEGIDETVDSVALSTGKLSEKLAYNTSIILGGEAFNQGRFFTQQTYQKDIYALQRSEILDKRICNYCLSMDGRVVALDDPIAKAGLFHSNCRGLWVEILNEEADKPPISGIPQTLRRRYEGGVNNFKQLDKPIVKSGSLADDFAKGELDLG